MTDNTPRFPSWPPSDRKTSIEEACVIIVRIREHTSPVFAEAKQMIHERYPGAEIG